MLAEVGFFATLFAFVAAGYAVLASLVGSLRARPNWTRSGRNAALLVAVFLTVATVSLLAALMSQDYQLAYVWSVSNPQMSGVFRFTALWGSQAGSLLFWSFVMSTFTAGAVLAGWGRYRRLMPVAIAVMMAVLLFFIGLSLTLENPFARYWVVGGEVIEATLRPADAVTPSAIALADSARGLNPLLRHFGMAIHPPLLYLGFIGFIIPFAFAVAALVTDDRSSTWIRASRRWLLAAWLFLSLGLLLGGRWAYDVLGWGGYWGWDPVENAAFLPWLIGTALLHSVMIEEKRGMLKTWNMVLVIATFSAVLFGTFATRSGLVESVHSFARSDIGLPMFLFWFSLTLLAGGLLLWRRGQGALRDDHTFTHLFSREALFVLNNFVFLALFVAIFWGSFGAPILSELLFNTNITLGTDYFMRVTPPLFAALYVLMAIAPLSAWGMTSLRRLGRALLVPLALTGGTLLLLALNGMGQPGALFGYGIVALAGWVAAYETFRAVRARQRAHSQDPARALVGLLSRSPRRYGGYLIHIGVAVIGIGVIGSTLFQLETQRTLAVGETLDLGGYTLRYDRFDGGQVAGDGRVMDIANLSVIRGDKTLATLRPRREFYPGEADMNTMTIAGSHSTLENDVYVLLINWDEVSANRATFKVYINPLVNLVWWGGLILIVGTVIAVYPPAVSARRPQEMTVAQPELKGVQA
ncbi:MAG: heme lyase CcmF/NrfE family subunit [Chloroflexota bacterium]